MAQRKSRTHRVTKETNVLAVLNLDSVKPISISTTIPFLDHMLELFSHHAGISLVVKATGDTHIDNHHLIEDIGIVLGTVLEQALGNKKGIGRYGSVLLPMDEALSYVALDISGRPHIEYSAHFKHSSDSFDYDLLEDFFEAFAINARITLHMEMKKGRSNHHIAESLFKGLGRALRQAVLRSSQKNPILPSTKGLL